MSVSLSPIFNGFQGFSIGGLPLAGGLLSTYLAGTSTPAGTYSDNTGLVLNANPIQLDGAGLPPNEIWLTVGVVYKFVLTDALGLSPRTYDNISGIDAAGSASSLATSLAASGGSALVGFLQAGSGAVARTAQSKMRDVFSVKDFGALGNGSADDAAAINTALTTISSNGGGLLYLPEGDYRHSVPIKIFSNTRFLGSNKATTYLTKTGAGTIALSGAEAAQANAPLVCLDSNPMSDGANNVNCSIWISDPIRAANIEIAGMTIRSTGTNSTASNVKHAICGMGADDSWIHDLSIENYSGASIVLPVFFAAAINRVHSVRCERGPSIEAGTSLNFDSNYALYCHKYALFLRSLKYISVKNNACDGLNNISNSPDYTDRTIDSHVYQISACYGVDFSANGAEQCFGSHVVVDSCVNVEVSKSVFLGPQSSYTGANQVALFQVLQLCQGVTIRDNTILRGGVTALQGGASAAAHHDLYVNVASLNQGFKYTNNWTANNLFDAPSAIYGNMVPTYLSNLKQGAQIFGDFVPVLTIPGATGVTITPAGDIKGRYSIVNGFMEAEVTLVMSSVTFAGTGTITISGLPFVNGAAHQARLAVDHSSGVAWATTEPYYLDISPGASSGILKNRTDTVSGVTTSVLVSTAAMYLHITGKVYVGDVVNVV